jgi:hypothetical protein
LILVFSFWENREIIGDCPHRWEQNLARGTATNASPARMMIGSARFTQPRSPTVASQQGQPLASMWVHFEYRNPPARLDTFKVEAGDEPVVGNAEGEPGSW